jgi:hypothetical protein
MQLAFIKTPVQRRPAIRMVARSHPRTRERLKLRLAHRLQTHKLASQLVVRHLARRLEIHRLSQLAMLRVTLHRLKLHRIRTRHPHHGEQTAGTHKQVLHRTALPPQLDALKARTSLCR